MAECPQVWGSSKGLYHPHGCCLLSVEEVYHCQRVTPGQHLAASTAAGVLPGSPNFSASRDTSGTAISLNVHMPSSSPKSCA